MTTRFLGTTSEIRAHLIQHMRRLHRMDIAVAFISSEWLAVFDGFEGRCKVVCWLNTTNTNPYAVDAMRSDGRFEIRHVTGMHAKVYLSRLEPRFVLVGSANLSSKALQDNDNAGNIEASVVLTARDKVAQTARWFDRLWKQATPLNYADLRAAKDAYDKRPRTKPDGSTTTRPWKPTARLKYLADLVRLITLDQLRELAAGWTRVHRMNPATMTANDVRHIVKVLSGWARHPGKFRPLLHEDIRRVRAAFSVAFDRSLPIGEKMRLLMTDFKLDGLGVRAWTMILYWRSPTEYIPFNEKTIEFIKDMKMQDLVSPNPSPRNYEIWCGFSAKLAARMRLPSIGHVDRMVWEHYAEKYPESAES